MPTPALWRNGGKCRTSPPTMRNYVPTLILMPSPSCPQTAFHARQAQAALKAGKHVFCEKPLGATLDEAVTMLHAATRSARIHQVAFTLSLFVWRTGVEAATASRGHRAALLHSSSPQILGRPASRLQSDLPRQTELCGGRCLTQCRVPSVRSRAPSRASDRVGDGVYDVPSTSMS